MLIPKEVIDDIIEKSDIVSIVSERVALSKKGRNFWGLCPFHQDQNASMSVSPEKKFFKCFSCQVSGTVLDFVKDFDNISFQEAIKKLAVILNYDLSKFENENPVKQNKNTIIYKLNEESLAFFKLNLRSNEAKPAVKYLHSRDITNEDIAFFEIGFLPKNNSLVEHLISKGYNISDIVEAGLGTYNEDHQKMYDIFTDRIMFPIRNENKELIGFSGRIIETNSEKPKYLNTKETPVFSKRKIAYNFSEAIKSARVKKELIVLEGYMDVISLHKNGIDNTIALMGTALSQYHVSIFKNIKGTIKMFLDGDEPGIKGNIEASQTLILNNQKVLVVNNPTNNDPDELIKQGKKAEIEKMISEALNPLEYIISKRWPKVNSKDFNSVEEFMKEICSFVLKCNNNILYETSIDELEKITGLSKEAIINFYKKISNKQINSISNNKVEEVKTSSEKQAVNNKNTSFNILSSLKAYELAEKTILFDLIKSNKNLELIKDKIREVKFPHKEFGRLILKIINSYEENMNYNQTEIKEIINQNFSQETLEEINLYESDPLMVRIKPEANTAKLIENSFEKLKMYSNEKKIAEINEMLNSNNLSKNDRDNLMDILSERIKKREEWLGNFNDKNN
ncbi:DNA primase [Mesoplasma florum W37]|uniref:DNA primase n=1 Tax=Mesoplasma florum TaxID=2151 RepID=A0AAD0HSZ2_MESFO|nr:DNA primase [Mesoplasma florum]AGY41344.1 DNA primase [Mesoplasma florum W37]AVN65684.1 DNA primase [Mesoplasma florum]